jgi:excinuclease ABC subunit C
MGWPALPRDDNKIMIPKEITIQNKYLPDKPGVYLYRNSTNKVIYVGKATSLKRRVSSYWIGVKDAKTTELIARVVSIEYIVCGSVLEALVMEANLIRRYQPKYNILGLDDKSFLYLAFSRTEFPHPVLLRGYELARMPKNKFLATFGPFIQPASLRAALEILRRIFPFSYCEPGQKRACFDYHLGKCPGVCIGVADKAVYRENIRSLIKLFKGESLAIIKESKKKMAVASAAGEYEQAALYRDRVRALTHVRDMSLLTREGVTNDFVNVFGRIEGYDISNIGGEYAVGSMVVFEDGVAKKSSYRIFHIKDVVGSNDVAMMAEVLRRRVRHAEWRRPDIILIDGGRGQLNAVKLVLEAASWKVPMIGIAKGITRKNDEIVPADFSDWELKRLIESQKRLFQQVRDEAHRFAISKYRARHRKAMII